MTKLPRRAALGLCAGFLGAATIPLTSRRARAADTIRIGTLGDLTGESATDTGMAAVYSAQIAIEDFGGEVLGRKIELLWADDQNKPDLGLTLARRWLDEEGASAIIGNTLSSTGIGIKNMCVVRQKPFLVGTSASSTFTQEECSPMTVVFGVNTYAMPKGVVSSLLAQKLDTWFFITADYAFGHSLEVDSSEFVTAGGGKVVGTVKAPLATTDYSSYLLQAQSSGAKVIGLAVQGADFINLVKQAAEFGIGSAGQTLAGLFVLDSGIIAAGLPNAAGMVAAGDFYWNMNEASRAFSKRMMVKTNGMPPNAVQVAPYSAALHYLRAIQAAGTTDGPAVVAQMKRTPIDDFWSKNVQIRADGQALRPMYLMRVKTPQESTDKYDVLKVEGTIAPAEAWRPLAQSACPFIRAKG